MSQEKVARQQKHTCGAVSLPVAHGIGRCIFTESQPLVLTLCWTRRLAAELLSVLNELRAGTAIKKITPFLLSSNCLLLVLLCIISFLILILKHFPYLLFFSWALPCLTYLLLWLPFFFQTPPPKHFSLIHVIAVCSCCLGNFSLKVIRLIFSPSESFKC